MDSSDYSITLHEDVPRLFTNPNGDSANELAKLINKEIGSEGFERNTASLDALLASVSDQLFHSSVTHRETIDRYLEFVIFAALQINSEVTHIGEIRKEGEPERQYKVAPLLPSEGPRIVGEHLAKKIHDRIWGQISRAVTPDSESDRNTSKEHFYMTSIHATILARGFAISETFRDSLWRVIEDVLVKGLFSGEEQEPEVFVALAAILLGAGKEIKTYMNGDLKGKGKSWLWYDDVRTEPDVEWGWSDVVAAVKRQPGPEMVDRLPGYVKENLECAKEHIMDKDAESWESDRLAAEAFRWASVDSGQGGV